MVVFILLVAALLGGAYVAFRYYTLRSALRRLTEEIEEIQTDLSQNHMLHLPVPDRELERQILAWNSLLDGIRAERRAYGKREKEFQEQLEHISHDLRTPLTVILGYTKLIQKTEAYASEEGLAEMIGLVAQKAEAMQRLTDQFYELSRLNAGDYGIKLASVDIARLLRESLAGNSQMFLQQKIEVMAKIPGHPVWVAADPAALERIFLNLLQNAGRYAKHYFNIALVEEGKDVAISFQNDTVSLSGKEASLLFERFYMRDAARSQKGTGLGLAIARALAEKMGGSLEAVLADGAGGAAGPAGEGREICFWLRMKHGCFPHCPRE